MALQIVLGGYGKEEVGHGGFLSCTENSETAILGRSGIASRLSLLKCPSLLVVMDIVAFTHKMEIAKATCLVLALAGFKDGIVSTI